MLFALLIITPVSATSHLTDRVIALDAGHGNGATGAIGSCNGTPVIEAAVNLEVRGQLKLVLEANGAIVFEVPQSSSRKDRVAAAEAASAEVLIPIHHNGSTDLAADYTKSFITQNNDKALAKPIHEALVAALGLPDKGIKHDGYGITVYGDIPGVLTESYFITNTDAACDFLGAQERVSAEVSAMYEGLVTYFSTSGDEGSGNSCPPGKQKQGKC